MIESFGRVLENENQKDYTTYKLSGKIKTVIYPDNFDKLCKLIKYLNSNHLKHVVLGNGSNVIFSNDYDGIVIKLDNLNELIINDTLITVGAGYSLMKLALKSANMGLSGLEFASGIPATVGGAIFGNAGAYKSEMAKVVKEIKVIDKQGNLIILSKDNLNFGYRDSKLKHDNLICVSALLELSHGDKEDILELIKERKIKRLSAQPLEYPSAGSVFRNPEGMFAGELIEKLGLKGYKIGGAMISEKHANFIVNTGTSTGEDVQKLIVYIQNQIKEKYNVDLMVEQEIVE